MSANVYDVSANEIGLNCAPNGGILERWLGERWYSLKRAVFGVVVTAVVFLTLGSVLYELNGIAAGDDLTAQEWSNVTLTQNVLADALGPTQAPWIAAYVDENATIETSVRAFTGPDGLSTLAGLLVSENNHSGFQFDLLSANENIVEFRWWFTGPIPAGILGDAGVDTGDDSVGRVYAVLENGQIQAMHFVVFG